MELERGKRIVLLIDHFSRKAFGQVVGSKKSYVMTSFLSKFYGELTFKALIADNGREFNNKEVEKWAKERNIVIKYAVTHFHQSNGRTDARTER